MAALIFVAREARDKARALPELDRLPVDELSGFADRLLVASALYYSRGRGDVTIDRCDVDAIMRHGWSLSSAEFKSLLAPVTAVGRVPDMQSEPSITLNRSLAVNPGPCRGGLP